jgi:hypothetical protein
MKEIASPAVSDTARAKNLSTLQKYLALHPPQQIDPHLMESNQIFIQFNVNGRAMTISEDLIAKLPMELRRQFMDGMSSEICEDTAFEIINS